MEPTKTTPLSAAAALLCAAIAWPAAAQTIQGPHALFKNSLNGAVIRLCDVYDAFNVHLATNSYVIAGWPAAGAGTLTLSSVANFAVTSVESPTANVGCVDLNLGYTGSFDVDQAISIQYIENVSSDGSPGQTGSILVHAADPALVIGDVAGAPTEEGGQARIPVRLRTRPAGNVTVQVTSTDASEGTASPSSLTFTQSNWSTNRTVTATGADDSLNDGDQAWNVRLNPASVTGDGTVVDSDYNTLADVNVAMTTVDQTGGPSQNGIAITSSPANATGYRVGENIDVRLDFNAAAAVTGAPLLAIRIGSDIGQARYVSGSGTMSLTFRYPVVPGDADADGISIWANDLTLNGGGIRVHGGTASARLRLTRTITNSASHKVDGSQGAPGVSSVALNTPQVGDAYERLEAIDVTVTFSKAVEVVGLPELALNIGTATRQAVYARERSTDTELLFRYSVAQADADADGVSIGPTALTLDGAVIRELDGTANAALTIGRRAIADSDGHKVTGSIFSAPELISWELVSTGLAMSGGQRYYRLGQIIEIQGTFDRPVIVTGAPTTKVQISAGDEPTMHYVARDSTATVLSFQWTVASGRRSAQLTGVGGQYYGGVSIHLPVELNDGSINDARDQTTPAVISVGTLKPTGDSESGHGVNGDDQVDPRVTGVAFNAPVVGDTYERGETIAATVQFDHVVDITGTPQLGLGIGANTRQADYASGGGTDSLVFHYRLVQADIDADGISASSTALTLNGGSIKLYTVSRDAQLGLGAHAIANAGNHKVDGSRLTPPNVRQVYFRDRPGSGDTFQLGEQILPIVVFDRPVRVNGRANEREGPVAGRTPQLALTVGAETRPADFLSVADDLVRFRYRVRAGDLDTDGISLFEGALTLSGGTINDARDATVAANLALGRRAFTNAAQYKVDGRLGPPGIVGLTLDAPALGDTYNRNETIEATVTFNKAVDVTGAPQLALAIGAHTRQANYVSGSGSAALVFRYTVLQADVDANGITIESGALTVSGGSSIQVAGGTTDAVRSLEAVAFSDNPAYKVDGANSARAFIASTSPSVLNESNLRGATVTVGLANTTFSSGATSSHFMLTTNVPGLTVGSLAPVSSGAATSTLTLAYTQADFDTESKLSVTVAAAAHAQSGALRTGAVAVLPGLDLGVQPTALTLNENPGSTNANRRTYTVTVDTPLTEPATVTVGGATGQVRVDVDGDMAGDQHTLTFSAANWATARTVTVTAVPDDDDQNEEVTLTHTAPGEGNPATVRVTVVDDDRGTVLIDADPATPAPDPGPLLLHEGDTADYVVRLSAQPTADATVAVASGDAGAVTTGTASLTFTMQNWSTAQTVTVTAVQDSPDAVDESVTITHTATGGGYGGTASRLRVGVSDDERAGTDYDTNENGLIEISNLAQLNAVRWDLNGDGAPSSGNAAAYSGASGAFAGASAGMGCPTGGCEGYELVQDLDFDTDGDGSSWASSGNTPASDSDDAYHNGGSGWNPIGSAGAPFAAQFDGQGHAVWNLFVSRSSTNVGLFGVASSAAEIVSLGVGNARLHNAGDGSGALVGRNGGRVAASWSSGLVRGGSDIGGLIGVASSTSALVASYSRAGVELTSPAGSGGGLVGRLDGGSVTASYSTGAVTGGAARHGFANGAANVATSYWDAEASGLDTSALGTRAVTAALQAPTSAIGIFAAWDRLDVDGDGDPAESPWHFGTRWQYPALRYRGADPVPQRGDYDLDDNGLVEVYSLAQLNAIRWDLDGDGAATSTNAASYRKAFRNHPAGMGCPNTGCAGYELANDLDFDTDGDGATWSGQDVADPDDAYYNGGRGWLPLGPATPSRPTATTHFSATFDGKGHVIANLFVNRGDSAGMGLFERLPSGATVRSLGLPDVRVRGQRFVGAVTGESSGHVAAVWASGTVAADGVVGGLVGLIAGVGRIVASYSTAAVECAGVVSNSGGGLAGLNHGRIATSYATGTVTGRCEDKGGLFAFLGATTASYWDTVVSGVGDDLDAAPPEGRTPTELRNPTAYAGLYADWDDEDVDLDGVNDDAWDFGDQWQWPVLKFGGLDVARQFALQPDLPPMFRPSTMPNRTYRKDWPIAEFLIPAAVGGEIATYAYQASGLPAGLSLGTPNCATERTVCGTPTATTTAALVTLHAHDGDDNQADSDRASLMFAITVVDPTAAIAATIPATLAEATLDGAEVVVTLTDTTFESGVAASSFMLNTAVSGLTVDSATVTTATMATLTLDYDDTDFDTAQSLGVTVAASAHALAGALTTATVPVTAAALEATATPPSLALNENSSSTFTVVLDSQPAADATAAVASSDHGAVTVDKHSLTFTRTNWNSAQTVTVTAPADDDPRDELVAVTLSAAGSGVLAAVPVTVTDDDRGTVLIDADPATAALEPGPLLLDEGASGGYAVRLSAQPSAPVTVTVASGDASAVTAAPAALTFTPQNWHTPRTVTATAVDDAPDAADESVAITHVASGGGYGRTRSWLRVAVSDDERTGTDYDTDENGLIEISTLAQLNAVRWDLDGNGAPSSGNAAAYSGASGAFPNAAAGMGCPTAGCEGYELVQDLDFDTDGDGSTFALSGSTPTSDSGDAYHDDGSGWAPIGTDGTAFGAKFDGRGHVVWNLFVNRALTNVGLFGVTSTAAEIVSLGVGDARIHNGADNVGALVGRNSGRVAASWTSGLVRGSTGVGGLIGTARAGSAVVASYSHAAVEVTGATGGGLIGWNAGDEVMASYSTGRVTGGTTRHGLADGSSGATASYWDREASGVATSLLGVGRATAELQAPTSAIGIFARWARLDVDGDGDPNESPWDFGTSSEYPALGYRGADVVAQRGDYDLDDNGLIEVYSLAQLNAIRWDLDADGSASSTGRAAYGKAFRNHSAGMGCPTDDSDDDDNDCTGYELANDLDFDTDGDGATHAGGASDADDAYHNDGSGWLPIGPATVSTPSDATHFNAMFNGKGKAIANLFVRRSRGAVGLFGGLAAGATVRALALPDAHVTATGNSAYAGAVAGDNRGRVAAVWSSGAMDAAGYVGGLVGSNGAGAVVVASYSTASVACSGAGGGDYGGGLVGWNAGTIATGYATGAVTGGCAATGGLTGSTGTVIASYWDVDRSGVDDDVDGDPPEGVTSAILRGATGTTGIYTLWNAQNVDGDGILARDVWDFGEQWQWPVLKFGGLDVARQFALQPNLPPTFGAGTVADKTYRKDFDIAPFLVPAASGGEGAGYTYQASGLPTGLSLGAPNCATRQVCGTPTATTAATVAVYAHDGDANRDDGDRAALTFAITVVDPTAAITATTPAALTEAMLDGAEITVTLTDTTFESGVTASSFTLNTTNVSGLRIASVAATTTTATLTLDYDDTDFDTTAGLGVTVDASAHALAGDLTTATVAVTPSLEATVTPQRLELNESASSTFTAVLDSVPATTTTVDVQSYDPGAVAPTPGSLTFTPQNWNTAQAVTVTALADDDPNNEITSVRLFAPGAGTLATVAVTVMDDDLGRVLIDADPATSAPDSGPLLLDEGDTADYAVRLSAAPTANATVTVTSADAGAVTVDQSSLTFTPQNWNTAQTVTATAVVEAGDAVDESVNIDHVATGGGYGGASARLRVAVSDAERTDSDYDTDENGLIEIATLAQLNAVRWDLDGDGAAIGTATSSYATAFPDASTGMGCPTEGCRGYELTRDLDFDTDGDGATWTEPGGVFAVDGDDSFYNGGAGWDPIGPASAPSDSTHFNAQFDGQGHSIYNLVVNRARDHVGLFAALGSEAAVRALGLPDAKVRSGRNAVAALAGASAGRVALAWVDGAVAGGTNVGGLVGATVESSSIVASYSKASVACGSQAGDVAGGLVGDNAGAIGWSYATGAVTGGCSTVNQHGLAGGSSSSVLAYWDRQASGVTTSAQGRGYTTAQLQTPTSATGIYAGWDNVDVDMDGDRYVDPHSSPWDFGTNLQYPALRFRGADTVVQRGDYDLDGDGLIEVYNLGQLHAIRWDPDGDGAPTSGNAGSYGKAFRNHMADMGCPTDNQDADDNDCTGYELQNDLDFDTDGDGATWTVDGGFTADSGDAYYNDGAGWEPIGVASPSTNPAQFNAILDGNGHVIENLLVNRSRGYVGLFAALRSGSAVVRSLGLPDARVRQASSWAGALVGYSRGRVAAVWTTGVVEGRGAVGGLAGYVNGGTVVASYSTAAVACTGTSVHFGGGLVGENLGTISASYSTGAVTGTCGDRHGLANTRNGGTVAHSYWDTNRSGIDDDSDDNPPEGVTSANLREPTGYTGVYAAWDDQDVDGDNTVGAAADADDDAWDFGDQWQWPVLKFGGLDTARQVALQPNVPPVFTGALPDRTYRRNFTIDAFEVPAASGGEIATYAYSASGLPTGLSFGAPTCAARTVCGTPMATTTATVTIFAHDGDDDQSPSDRAALTFTITVVDPTAAITATVPAALTEAMLNGAAVTVTLTGTTFIATTTSAHFVLNTTLTGLTIRSAATAAPTTATLTLDYDDTDFDSLQTLSVTVTASAHALAGALTTGSVPVSPSLGAAVSPRSLALNEGASSTFTAVLDGAPAATTTVSVASGDAGAATAAPSSLTFTPQNWSTAQAVTVTALADDDPNNEMTTITLSASGVGVLATVSVTVTDDDTADILLDADPHAPNDQSGPLELAELSTALNHSVSYTVRLSAEPSQDVTVTIVSADPTAVAVGDTNGMPGVQNTLTFTSTIWSVPQTVTLTAQQDGDIAAESVTITHTASTASPSEYANLMATLTANTIDKDVPGFVFDADPSSPGTDEAGPLALLEDHAADASKEYTVRLSSQPTATTTVTIESGDTSAVTVDDTDGDSDGVQNTLTFTAANWNTPQTVTLTARQDDGGANERVTIAHAASTAATSEYTDVTGDFMAEVDDDETPAMTLSASTLSVAEQDSANYTVRLTVPPEDVAATVSITGEQDGITVNVWSLTFTSSNYDTARTVTVTAANDPNGTNEVVTLTHTASGGEYAGAATTTLTVTATDDEAPGLLVSPTQLEVEENTSGAYTIRLSTEPTGDVTVTVSGFAGAVTVDTSAASGNQNTLTFTQTNWATLQTVTVAAGDDDNAGNETLALAHSASGGGYGALAAGSRPDVQVRVDDDDVVGIVLDADPAAANDQPGPLTLDELSTALNNSVDYTVRLATEPTLQVEVAVSSGDRAVHVDAGDATPRTRTLTFTTTSWATAQTVTATAADDDDAMNERVEIAHAASGGDYAGVTAALVAETTDDDTPAIVVDAAALTGSGVAEGFEATYTVRLETEPDGVATVSAAVQGGVSVDLDDGQAGAQSSLRFDAANWSTLRTATVRGLEDDDAESGTATLRHTASGADYGGAAAVEVTFAVTDDDAPALVLDTAAVTVNEGSTATYAAALATAPVGGPVTVSANSSNAALAMVSPATLTFSASDWNVPRMFTVTGSAEGAAAIAHAASGADYDGATSTVAVEVRDGDAAGVRIEPPQLRVREGESGVYGIRLNTDPGADVTVTPMASGTELTVASDPLTFTTTDWSTERTLTVTVREDDGADDETLSVTHAVSGGYAGDAAPALMVLVRDNDAPGIVFDPAGGLRLSESATTTRQYTAALTAQPTGEVTVRLAGDDAGLAFDADGNMPNDQNELTFTAANWNAPQTVEVRAAADADAATETAMLRHTASGGGYDGVTAAYAVVLEDADAAAQPQGVTATPGTGALTVRWSAAANAQRYVVEWRRGDEEWSAARRLETADTTARITGLAAGARYLVRVTGLSLGWAGEASAEVAATVPRPRPPSPPPLPPSPPPSPPSPPPSPPANGAPGAQRQLADVVLDAGQTVEVQLAGAFADPDGDALAYSASSSNESAARAVVAATLLRVTGVAAGATTIEVRATDPGGLSAAQRFAVRVVAPLSLAGAEASEGGVARLRVELGRARSAPTAFRWRVLADADRATADADADDHGDASGEGFIAAGATAAEIEVPILDDAAIEPAREWFAVEATLAGGGRAQARVAILEGVCDRTAAVRDALAGAAACTAPSMADLAATRALDLQRRGIGALRPADLLGLSGLHTLDLRGNALAALPAGLLSATPRLRALLLGDNRLAALRSEALSGLASLRDLDLSANALRSLPDGLFASVANLRSLRLDGNPGAPFPLRAELVRTDAEPWAPGPATVRARVPLGAPFAVELALTVAGGSLRGAAGATSTTATVAAGSTAGAALTAAASAAGAMRIRAPAPTVPTATCGDAPCWRGLDGAAGVPLVLFSQPPTAGQTPTPAPLYGGEVRLPLEELATAGDGGALRWTVRSSDESVAAVRIEGGQLVVEPAYGAEGAARIEAMATDADGHAVTVAFDVQVEFYWPRPGWRNAVVAD